MTATCRDLSIVAYPRQASFLSRAMSRQDSRNATGGAGDSGVLRGHDGVDAAAHLEVAHDGHVLGSDGRHEIVEDAVRDVLVEVSLVSERPEVQLQRFQFHA